MEIIQYVIYYFLYQNMVAMETETILRRSFRGRECLHETNAKSCCNLVLTSLCFERVVFITTTGIA